MAPQEQCNTGASNCTIDLILVVNQVWLWVDESMVYLPGLVYAPRLLTDGIVSPLG